MFKKNKITIPQFEQQSPQHELNISQLEEALTLYEWRFCQFEHKVPHFEGSIVQKEQKYNPSIWATKSSMWTKHSSTWESHNSLWGKIFPQLWLWYVPQIEWWLTQNRTNHPGSALIVPLLEPNEENFHSSVVEFVIKSLLSKLRLFCVIKSVPFIITFFLTLNLLWPLINL